MTTSIVDEDIARILAEPLDWGAFAGSVALVSGATGMIGQYVVRTLLALESGRPAQVIALTRRPERAQRLFGSHAPAGLLRILQHDVAAPLPNTLQADLIVHAASPASPTLFAADPVGVIRANVMGADSLLVAAARSRATFCFVSSSEVYGAPPPPLTGGEVLLKEDALGLLDPLAVRSAYPESKRLAEALCVAYGAQFGTPYRIARLSYTYGPGMDLEDSRVQAYFFRQALRGEDIELQSDGRLVRTYTYVSDAVSALFYLLQAKDNGAYNVADERARISIGDLAALTLGHSAAKAASVRVAATPDARSRPGPAVLPDCSRLRALGWSARVDLAAGVARTIRHHALDQPS